MVRVLFAAWLVLSGVPAGAAQEVEPGFEPLFNGKDFTGMKFFFGEGKTEPGETFRVADGAIVCSGRPNGYWYTEKKYKDFTLRFSYRYAIPNPLPERLKGPDGKFDESKFGGNSGYLFYLTQHQVWPRSIEVQGMNRDVLGLIAIGKFPVKKLFEDKEARARARKPVGEWNDIEIASKGGKMTCSLNGVKVSEFGEFEPFESVIAFQSESAEIHWKNVRIKPE
jgi:hypothetical protein